MRILLDNALRHTPEGTHVTVSAGRSDGAISLTVADDGPGLTDRAQVFERFYTGDATRGAGPGPGDRPRAGRAHGGHAAGRVQRQRVGVHAAAARVRGTTGHVSARLVAALAAAVAAAGGLSACSLGDDDDVGDSSPRDVRTTQGAGGRGAGPARRAGRRGALPAPVPRRGHRDLRLRRRRLLAGQRRGRGRPGVGLRAGRRRLRGHQRPRGHRGQAARHARRPGACTSSSPTPTACGPASWATT